MDSLTPRWRQQGRKDGEHPRTYLSSD